MWLLKGTKQAELRAIVQWPLCIEDVWGAWMIGLHTYHEVDTTDTPTPLSNLQQHLHFFFYKSIHVLVNEYSPPFFFLEPCYKIYILFVIHEF